MNATGLAGLVILCVVSSCTAQYQLLNLANITEMRFENVYTDYGREGAEYYGRLELSADNRTWMRASWSDSYRSISDQTGNVICRSLGYGPFRSSWRDSSYGGYHRVNLATIVCQGNESTIARCYDNARQQNPAYDSYDLFIRCAKSRCADSNRTCNQICYNNPVSESRICGCFPGYSLIPGNLTTCEDINECSKNNGGCSHGCINTAGSHLCTCPIFSSPNRWTRKCEVTGYSLHCESNKMTVTFLKQAYPMMRLDEVTLLGSECAPSHNDTHVTFTTMYDSCMTIQSSDGKGIKYSNAVVSKERANKSPNVRFSGTVNIPFNCVIRRQSVSTASTKTMPLTFSTSPSTAGTTHMRLSLCYDISCTRVVKNEQVAQGAVLYAEINLICQDSDLKFTVRRCSTRAKENALDNTVDLIKEGRSAVEWVSVLDSSGEQTFKFVYPAFTLNGYEGILSLECTAELTSKTSDKEHSSISLFSSTSVKPSISKVSMDVSTVSSSASVTMSALAPASRASHGKLKDQQERPVVSSCQEAKSEGIHRLILGRRLVPVWCDLTSPDGPWLTIMRRTNGKQSFNKTWVEYESGFGNLDKEFWLGNLYLHEITRIQGATMRIEMTTFANVSKYAEYYSTKVGSASGGYNLTLGDYRGTAGDMRNTSGCTRAAFVEKPTKFSTYDSDNDGIDDYQCAGRGGGWWYHDCVCTCLTCGPSANRQVMTRIAMTYYPFNDLFALKKAEIKLRFGTVKEVYYDSVSSNASTVHCDSQHVTVTLNKENFDSPFEETLEVHSDSFLRQSHDEQNVILKFSLRALDTSRQENATHFVYTKLATAETTSSNAYYRRVIMSPKCIFAKSVELVTEYNAVDYDVSFEITGGGYYDAQIIMAKDEHFKELLNSTSGIHEGSTVYVKVVPVTHEADLRLALLSCYLSGAKFMSQGYQVINNSCSIHKDVQILARDMFVTRLPSFVRDEQGTRVSCEVHVCTSEDDACNFACGSNGFEINGRSSVWSSNTQASAVLIPYCAELYHQAGNLLSSRFLFGLHFIAT